MLLDQSLGQIHHLGCAVVVPSQILPDQQLFSSILGSVRPVVHKFLFFWPWKIQKDTPPSFRHRTCDVFASSMWTRDNTTVNSF